MGHSFGANHDDVEHEENEECPNDEMNPFIMTSLWRADQKESAENKDKFSHCSVDRIKEKTLDKFQRYPQTDCFKDIDADDYYPELEIAICGNFVVEPGEECDCGLTVNDCSDPCCYPAIIPNKLRVENGTALPCTYNKTPACLARPAFVYGIVVPFVVMGISVLLLAIFLTKDWKGNRICYTHVTKHNVRIINNNNTN